MQRLAGMDVLDSDADRLLTDILANGYGTNFNVERYLTELQDVTNAGKQGVYSGTHTIFNPISGSSDDFGKYLNPEISTAYKPANIGALSPEYLFSVRPDSYQRTISTKGALTDGNKAALSEIHKYLHESRVYDALDGLLKYLPDKELEVSVDGKMPQHVLGQTKCEALRPYCDISLNKKLYSKPYTQIGDKNSQLIVKYLQAATMIHEYIHKVTLGSNVFKDAIKNLKEMKYSDENIRGFLEMYAEAYTKKALEKDPILSHMAKMYSPYKHASDMGEHIYNELAGNGMEGMQRLVYGLASGGDISKMLAEKYVKPLNVRAPDAARYLDKGQNGNGCAGNCCNRYDHPIYV